VVNLQVHLHQSLLHVLDMRRRVLEQTLALTDIRSQLGDPTLGPKAGAQQTIRMKPLQPLRIPRQFCRVGASYSELVRERRSDRAGFPCCRDRPVQAAIGTDTEFQASMEESEARFRATS
jgi:hypothetical protein